MDDSSSSIISHFFLVGSNNIRKEVQFEGDVERDTFMSNFV